MRVFQKNYPVENLRTAACSSLQQNRHNFDKNHQKLMIIKVTVGILSLHGR